MTVERTGPPGDTGAPKRIQRRRTKGWRMPAGAVYVGRPTVWGSPFPVTAPVGGTHTAPSRPDETCYHTRESSVAAYRAWITAESDDVPLVNQRQHRVVRQWLSLGDLTGRDLACWCPMDQPCHADVLLELANKPQPGELISSHTGPPSPPEPEVEPRDHDLHDCPGCTHPEHDLPNGGRDAETDWSGHDFDGSAS